MMFRAASHCDVVDGDIVDPHYADRRAATANCQLHKGTWRVASDYDYQEPSQHPP